MAASCSPALNSAYNGYVGVRRCQAAVSTRLLWCHYGNRSECIRILECVFFLIIQSSRGKGRGRGGAHSKATTTKADTDSKKSKSKPGVVVEEEEVVEGDSSHVRSSSRGRRKAQSRVSREMDELKSGECTFICYSLALTFLYVVFHSVTERLISVYIQSFYS